MYDHNSLPHKKKQLPKSNTLQSKSFDRGMVDRTARAMEKAGFRKKAVQLKCCSRHIVTAECPNGHEAHVIHADRCRSRWCPICSKIKAKIRSKRTSDVILKIQKENPLQRWALLTLTIKTVPGRELKATIDEMMKAWGRFRKKRNVKRAMKGCIRTMEVTWKKRDGQLMAHPHIHILVAMGDYLEQSEWRDAWKEAMRLEYDPIVDIRAVKDLSQVACEVSKYVSKTPSEAIHADVLRFEVPALANRKLWFAHGICKDADIVAREENEEIANYNELRDSDLDDKPCKCATCGADLITEQREWNAVAQEYVRRETERSGNEIEVVVRGTPGVLKGIVIQVSEAISSSPPISKN